MNKRIEMVQVFRVRSVINCDQDCALGPMEQSQLDEMSAQLFEQMKDNVPADAVMIEARYESAAVIEVFN